MVEEKIVVTVEAKNEATGVLEKVQESITKLNRITGKQEVTTSKLNKATGNLDIVNRKTTTGLKVFRMEALGLLFGGMAIERTFGRITKAGFDLYGITELLNETMAITMLPVMDLLGPVIFDIADAFMNMDDSQKLLIGSAMLLGQALGGALSGLGQAILFINSLEQIGGLAGLFTNLTATFTSLKDLVGKPMEAIINFTNKGLDKIDAALGNIGFASFIKGPVGVAVLAGIITFELGTIMGYSAAEAAGYGVMSLVVGGMLRALGLTFGGALAGAVIPITVTLLLGQIFGLTTPELAGMMISQGLAMGVAAFFGLTAAAVVGVGLIIPILFVLGKIFGLSDATAAGMAVVSGIVGGIAAYFGISAGVLTATAGGIFLPIGIIFAGSLGVYKLGEWLENAFKPIHDLLDSVRFLMGGSPGRTVLQNWGDALANWFASFAPHTAEGGIVTQAQMRVVGEAGPEAIIPLDKAGGFGGTNFYNSINIYNPTIDSNGRVDDLARKVADYIGSDYRRLTYR